MKGNECCAVILAAGEGKRMKSSEPKVLAKVAQKPMISWVIGWVQRFGIEDISVIAGHKKEILERYLRENHSGVQVYYQPERKGTGHAVMMAKEFLRKHSGKDVLVLTGDAPFVDTDTISKTYSLHKAGNNSATVISAKIKDPFGYGRIIRDGHTGAMVKIVEEKDASQEERLVTEVNSAAFWFKVDDLLEALDEIKDDNSQHEYYLPDTIKILLNRGLNVDAGVSRNLHIALGANDKKQLKELDSIAREYYEDYI